MDIKVRYVREEELDRVNELRQIVNDMHVKARPDIFKDGFGEELKKLAYERYSCENSDIIVAEEGGEMCGFATVQYARRPESAFTYACDIYHIEELCVDERCRRKGVASAILDFMKSEAKRLGFKSIELSVWDFNTDARALYENAGFAVSRRYMEFELG